MIYETTKIKVARDNKYIFHLKIFSQKGSTNLYPLLPDDLTLYPFFCIFFVSTFTVRDYTEISVP